MSTERSALIRGCRMGRAAIAMSKPRFSKRERSTSALEMGVLAITAKARWAERDGEDVEQWLKENKYIESAYAREKL